MDSKQLISEWQAKHPNSGYFVAEHATCESCNRALTDDERWDNITENESQDGNMHLCEQCRADDEDN